MTMKKREGLVQVGSTMRELRKKYGEAIRQFGHHAKVVSYSEKSHQLELSVGFQHFRIGPDYDTKVEAEWLKIMLCLALSKLKPKKIKEEKKA